MDQSLDVSYSDIEAFLILCGFSKTSEPEGDLWEHNIRSESFLIDNSKHVSELISEINKETDLSVDKEKLINLRKDSLSGSVGYFIEASDYREEVMFDFLSVVEPAAHGDEGSIQDICDNEYFVEVLSRLALMFRYKLWAEANDERRVDARKGQAVDLIRQAQDLLLR